MDNNFCFVDRFASPLKEEFKRRGLCDLGNFANLTAKQMWEIPGMTEEVLIRVNSQLRSDGLGFKDSREQDVQVQDLFLCDLDLTVRAWKVLFCGGLRTVEEIQIMGQDGIRQLAGRKDGIVTEVEVALEAKGLELEKQGRSSPSLMERVEERVAGDGVITSDFLAHFESPLREALQERGIRNREDLHEQLTVEEFLALPGATPETVAKMTACWIFPKEWNDFFQVFPVSLQQALRNVGIKSLLQCLKLTRREFLSLPGVRASDVNLVEIGLSAENLCFER